MQAESHHSGPTAKPGSPEPAMLTPGRPGARPAFIEPWGAEGSWAGPGPAAGAVPALRTPRVLGRPRLLRARAGEPPESGVLLETPLPVLVLLLTRCTTHRKGTPPGKASVSVLPPQGRRLKSVRFCGLCTGTREVFFKQFRHRALAQGKHCKCH